MLKLNRRTMMGAGTAAAAGLIAPESFAQDAQAGTDKKARPSRASVQTAQLPGLAGGEKRSSSTKRWYAAAFPELSVLVNYVNTPPAQGAGEVVVVSTRPDGSVTALIYL